MFDLVVVGYNTPISMCSAVSAGIDAPSVASIVFCDNSTDDAVLQLNSETSLPKLEYLPMRGNVGLPFAYNAALSLTRQPYLMLFDDDTEVGPGYFSAVQNSITLIDSDIYVPVVTAGARPLSPCSPKWLRYGAVRNLEEVPVDFTAINAGMTISRAIFERLRFNEDLFLDFVDHDFMKRAHAFGCRAVVLEDVRLDQDYSLDTDDWRSALARMRIFRRDSRVFYQGVSGSSVRAVRIALRYVRVLRLLGRPR